MPRIAFVLALLAGCGSSGTSATQACSDFAKANCMKRMTCSNGANITSSFGDMNTCLAREQLQCTIGLGAPSTGNSSDLVEQCVAAYASFSCSDFFANNPPAPCVPAGSKATNAPCAFGGQCATTYCNNNKTAVCGTCGSAPATGGACTMSNCARGQTCPLRSNVCTTPGAMGDSCDNNTAPCGADLACIGNTAGNMGTCMAGGASGAACGGTTGAGCDGTMGLTCSGMTGSRTCQPTVYAADGMPCGIVMNTFVGCANGGDCYTATGVAMSTESGTCKAAAADGAACDTTLGPPCLLPARCVVSGTGTAGTCTVPSGSTCG